MTHKHTGRRSRRELLGMGAVLGGSLLAGRHVLAAETEARKLGVPLGPYSERSPFEKAVRWRRESKTPETGSSFTPLHDSVGTVTPSALHYERHHSGIPTIDPARHGLVSGGEWTGVALSLLLAEAGAQPRASWVIAEGADACRMMRSIPLATALENSLLAYGQNGEAMRPAQGYPLRLINPGWEGNTNVKWLHSLKLTDQPYMARDETSKYSDLMPDGKARIFTYAMEAKSVITFPSGGQTLPM